MARPNTRNIRKLLMEAFNPEELRTLCFDEFRDVYEIYNDASKPQLIRQLIEYCDRKGAFPRLLALVAEDVPGKYAEYEGRLWFDDPPATIVSPPLEPATNQIHPPSPPEPKAHLAESRPAAIKTKSLPTTLTLTTPVKMEFVLVPAGEFLMGSDPAKDKYANDDEQPQHVLTLPDYYIGKYPVTNAQYAAFVQATGHEAGDKWLKKGWLSAGKIQFPSGGEDHPAIYVSWHDAVAFCRWASQQSDYLIRLPTEAEWEKAARGTDGRIYPWGNQPPTAELCNFRRGVGDTTPVGKYSPQGDSPYGVADMSGNVWEWAMALS
jgi:serine/threonine-protein kinase